ncbi:MAG TPA: hypothetical protein VFT59_00290 [Candidatus Saccharimonadales bacterium]|nr:hypothetical protein [Candidatus Saccharimonadales bacterium]
MSRTDDLLEKVREHFHNLYGAYHQGHVSYQELLNSVPNSIFYVTHGTPGRIGSALEQYSALAASDPMAPVRQIRAMASAVLMHVQKFSDDGRQETWQDLEYHWSVLRGFVLNAVAPGHSHYWIESLVQEAGLEQLVVNALTEGAATYNQYHSQSVWHHDHWERTVSTEQIVQWFEAACAEARHQHDSHEGLRGN